jgi:hypothetical protein
VRLREKTVDVGLNAFSETPFKLKTGVQVTAYEEEDVEDDTTFVADVETEDEEIAVAELTVDSADPEVEGEELGPHSPVMVTVSTIVVTGITVVDRSL